MSIRSVRFGFTLPTWTAPQGHKSGPPPRLGTSENYGKIIKNVMNRVQVCPFGLILCQDGAMVSRNPMECLPLSKTAKRPGKMRKMPRGPRGPGGPLEAPIAPRGTALRCSTSGAFYTGCPGPACSAEDLQHVAMPPCHRANYVTM